MGEVLVLAISKYLTTTFSAIFSLVRTSVALFLGGCQALSLSPQPDKNILHIVIGINRGEEGLDFFQMRRAQ